jgi:hypothetical protein
MNHATVGSFLAQRRRERRRRKIRRLYADHLGGEALRPRPRCPAVRGLPDPVQRRLSQHGGGGRLPTQIRDPGDYGELFTD